jgi:hypothetical protein
MTDKRPLWMVLAILVIVTTASKRNVSLMVRTEKITKEIIVSQQTSF